MRTVGTVGIDPLAEGTAALARGDWSAARSSFEQVIAAGASGGEAFEGLGTAAAWLDEGDAAIAAREEAYRRYREAGRPTDAARIAIWTAVAVHDFRGQVAVARGWLRRGSSLLEDRSVTPELAWLLGFDAHLTLLRDNDPTRALPSIRRAREIGRACSDT